MRKDTIKKIAALCAALAMMTAAGCGYIEDLPADEGSGAGSSLAETVDNAEESAADDTEESAAEENMESVEDIESAADESTESADEAEDSQAEEDAQAGNVYTNEEFGFSLPLPDGAEYNEYEAELQPSFDDDAVQFRPLMETIISDNTNMAVQLWNTQKTLDDLVQARRDYVDSTNSQAEELKAEGTPYDTVELLEVSDAAVGGAEARIVTERLDGSNGTFYTLRAYYSLGGGNYIYIQGNCCDEAALAQLKTCAEGFVIN